jgi:hypothetical protein
MPAPAAIVGMIPWSLLLDNGPRIFEAAQKLVRLARSPDRIEVVDRGIDGLLPANDGAPNDAIARAVIDLEKAVGALNAELLDATELISSLAVANQGLIRQIQVLKTWLIGVSVASGLGVVLAAMALSA